jgi:hemerythrin-like domain-containing protein
MTEPSEALAELLRQHEALRAIADTCEQLADEVDAGRGEVGTLVREVAKLRAAFTVHNQFEEQVLRPILATIDAFGEVRIDRMVADHVVEHRALASQLDAPTAALRATLETLRAHLAAEERYFLSARVLKDDIVSVESTS